MSSDHTPHPESSPRATEQKTTQPHVTQKTIGAFPASLREMLPTPGTSPVSLSLLVILVAMAILARVPATQNAVHTWFTFTWDQFSLLRIWTPFTALLVPGRFDGFLLQLAVVLFVTPRSSAASAHAACSPHSSDWEHSHLSWAPALLRSLLTSASRGLPTPISFSWGTPPSALLLHSPVTSPPRLRCGGAAGWWPSGATSPSSPHIPDSRAISAALSPSFWAG